MLANDMEEQVTAMNATVNREKTEDARKLSFLYSSLPDEKKAALVASIFGYIDGVNAGYQIAMKQGTMANSVE